MASHCISVHLISVRTAAQERHRILRGSIEFGDSFTSTLAVEPGWVEHEFGHYRHPCGPPSVEHAPVTPGTGGCYRGGGSDGGGGTRTAWRLFPAAVLRAVHVAGLQGLEG